MRRCHRSSVSGVTTKIDHRGLGRRRLRAASSARSWAGAEAVGAGGAGLSAGGGGPGSPPLWRPPTASTAPSTRKGGIAPGRRTTRPPAPPTGRQHAHHSRAVTCALSPRNDFWHPTGDAQPSAGPAPPVGGNLRRGRRPPVRGRGCATNDAVPAHPRSPPRLSHHI